jgi:hypothetical protein
VGTKEKHGFEHATTEAYDMFQPHLKMNMVTVHVNGDEMAWVIENHFTMNGETLKTHSIETFAWDAAGDLLIKTSYDMPADVGEGDDPYEFLLGKENVIPTTDPLDLALVGLLALSVRPRRSFEKWPELRQKWS